MQNLSFSRFIDQDKVLGSRRFQTWSEKILASGCKIQKIEVLNLIPRGEHDFFSAYLECEILTPEGHVLNRGLHLRGHSVVIIPIIESQGQLKTLVVRQRRIVDGAYSLEFPAGGIADDVSPVDAALQEVQEELGLQLCAEDLVPLVEKPLAALTSCVDECIHWYAFKKRFSSEELQAFSKCQTGVAQDQEYLFIEVMNLFDVNSRSENCLTRVGLELLRENANRLGL